MPNTALEQQSNLDKEVLLVYNNIQGINPEYDYLIKLAKTTNEVDIQRLAVDLKTKLFKTQYSNFNIVAIKIVKTLQDNKTLHDIQIATACKELDKISIIDIAMSILNSIDKTYIPNNTQERSLH